MPHAALLAEIAALRALVATLSVSNFGTLTPPATRQALAALPGPADIIGLDIRKMHELNAVLGWDATTAIVAELLACRQAPGRIPDILGQWGADEFVIAVPAGDGAGVLGRLLRQAGALTARLSVAQRAALSASTGGLIDGVSFAAVLVPDSTAPLGDAARAIVLVNQQKSTGAQTGSRATSGARGTLLLRAPGR
jgi:hypothetical protein